MNTRRARWSERPTDQAGNDLTQGARQSVHANRLTNSTAIPATSAEIRLRDPMRSVFASGPKGGAPVSFGDFRFNHRFELRLPALGEVSCRLWGERTHRSTHWCIGGSRTGATSSPLNDLDFALGLTLER